MHWTERLDTDGSLCAWISFLLRSIKLSVIFHRAMTSVVPQNAWDAFHTFCFGYVQWEALCCKFPPFFSPSLTPSMLLSFFPLTVWCDWSVFCQCARWRYKTPWLGVETPAACCLILKNAAIKTLLLTVTLSSPCRHLQQHNWLGISSIPPCVKDLQHSLQHAWKGKTNSVWTTGG